ncbi:nitroreductase family protein, partial [Bacillus atrophaeus]
MPHTEQINQHSSIRDIIRNRRSIRKFKAEPVASDIMLEMLDSAVYAP